MASAREERRRRRRRCMRTNTARLICAALLPAAVAAQSGAGPGRCIRGCDGADEQAFVCPGQTDHCECPYDCGRDIDRDGVPDWCDCALARACCLGAPPPPPPPPCGSGVLSSFVSQVETACCERDAADQCTKLNQLPDSCSATCAPVLADFLAECSSAMPDNFRNTLLPLAATCSTESGEEEHRGETRPSGRADTSSCSTNTAVQLATECVGVAAACAGQQGIDCFCNSACAEALTHFQENCINQMPDYVTTLLGTYIGELSACPRGGGGGDRPSPGEAPVSACYYTCTQGATQDNGKCTSPDGQGGHDCCASAEWNEPQTCARGWKVTQCLVQHGQDVPCGDGESTAGLDPTAGCWYTCVDGDGNANVQACTSPNGRGSLDCCANESAGERKTCSAGYTVQDTDGPEWESAACAAIQGKGDWANAFSQACGSQVEPRPGRHPRNDGSHPEACSHECADLMVPWHEQCGNQEQSPDQELLYSYCLQTLGRDPCQAGDAWGLCPGMPGGGGHR